MHAWHTALTAKALKNQPNQGKGSCAVCAVWCRAHQPRSGVCSCARHHWALAQQRQTRVRQWAACTPNGMAHSSRIVQSRRPGPYKPRLLALKHPLPRHSATWPLRCRCRLPPPVLKRCAAGGACSPTHKLPATRCPAIYAARWHAAAAALPPAALQAVWRRVAPALGAWWLGASGWLRSPACQQSYSGEPQQPLSGRLVP